MKTKSKTQIEKDIAFCIDECEMDDEQIGEMLRATENLGNIGVEYFCEEFVFLPEEQEEMDRIHNDEYLNIAEFNAMYWEGN
tara:strand:- start:320 stop:565 length:246 start_codon:yes stop_codon:yes gene_type:complete